MTCISVDNISKQYGETVALDGLSFTVEEGELFAFLGPNGAGKTTTIELLTGQKKPDSGRIEVLGESPSENPNKVREKVGILPEKESPADYLTVQGQFEYVGKARELDESYVEERIDFWVDFFDLREHLNTYNTDLSRGQQQKVMIAKAFFHEPELVFIDEPLANLDPIVQMRVKEYFKQYVEDGNTIFLSTHHIEVADELCTKVAVIEDGALTTVKLADEIEQESLTDLFVDEVSIEV